MFAQMLEQSQAPKLVVVDTDGQDDPAAAMKRLAGMAGTECKIIAIGSANDIELYRKMLTAGAVDYLVKPLATETFGRSYSAALRGAIGGKGEAKEAKIVVMIGVRGGVGASTIAVNTGWLLAHELKFQCALLDLDLQYGTSALALDIEPGRGLRDVVSSPQRVDSLMVASSIVAASDQFAILGAEESVEDIVPIDSAAITALLKEMRGNFDFIIIDLPRHMLASQKRLLAAAHEIVLIAEMSLAGIRDTLRIKNALQSLGSAAHVTLMASRTNASQSGQVDRDAFEKGAQIKIDFIVPEDAKAVTEAANTGKTLGATAQESPVTKVLLAFASRLSGKTPTAGAQKKGLFDTIAAGIAKLTGKKEGISKPAASRSSEAP